MLASFTSQDSFTPDDGLIVGQDDPMTRKITLSVGQNLARGSLLGKVTADGKFLLSLSAAVDGSQTPHCILAEACDATAAEKETVAYFAGVFDENLITYGTAHTAASVREALRDVSIKLQSSVVR